MSHLFQLKNVQLFSKKKLTPSLSSEIFKVHTVQLNTKTQIKMRTKTLLMAAVAAFAASVITSQAQVYSQNIVGYVNNPVPSGFSAQSAPFDNAAGNAVTNLIPNTGQWDGSYVYVWNGHSYTVYTLDSTLGGIADVTDSYATNCPVLNPGTAFFLSNQTGSPQTNTYVGTVHIGSGSYPGTSTNVILASAAFSLVAPVIPVSGGISSVCGLTNSAGALDGDYIYVPKIIGGVFHGYDVTTIDSTLGGFADVTDSTNVPEPVITLGTGFFFNNQNLQTVNWVQSLGQ